MNATEADVRRDAEWHRIMRRVIGTAVDRSRLVLTAAEVREVARVRVLCATEERARELTRRRAVAVLVAYRKQMRRDDSAWFYWRERFGS